MKKETALICGSGLVTGAASVMLVAKGNPENMGFCIACFIRDIAGACGLHSAAAVQYIRPEIIGLVLGSFFLSLVRGEFKPRAGSAPATRFLIGVIVMIGSLVFLGCPLRMVIRLGGGDGNALVGLLGFVSGILVGIFFIRKGFNLKRSYPVCESEGFVMPGIVTGLLVLVLAVPSIFAFSVSGPGSKHAPFILSLAAGLVVGALAQRSRLCMVGGIRDAVMFRDFKLLLGFACIFAAVLAGNIALGKFSGFSTYLQPIAHVSQLWNFAGMAVVGWGSVLLGGCPMRQLILAGEGNGDSAVTVLGMLVGSALSHNWKLAGSAASVTDGVYSAGGVSVNGKIAVIVCLCILMLISLLNMKRKEKVNA